MAKVAEKPAAPSLPTAAIGESEKLFSAIEGVMFSLIADGKTFDDLNPNEYLLCQRLGWDRKRIVREFGIRQGIAKHQTLAGTGAERKAAAARLERAKQQLATEGAELREQLAKLKTELEAKIAAVERESRDAEHAINVQNRSVDYLRRNLPEHLRIAGSRSVVKASIATRQEVLATQRKIDGAYSISQIKTGNFSSLSAVKNHGESVGIDFLAAENPDRPLKIKQVNWPKWQKYVEQLQAEVPALVEKLKELRQQERAEIAEAEAEVLSHYVPR